MINGSKRIALPRQLSLRNTLLLVQQYNYMAVCIVAGSLKGQLTCCACVCQKVRKPCACMVDGSTAVCAVCCHLIRSRGYNPLMSMYGYTTFRLSMCSFVFGRTSRGHTGEGRNATQDTHTHTHAFLPRGNHCAVLVFVFGSS